MKKYFHAAIALLALLLVGPGQSEASIQAGNQLKLLDRVGTPGGVFEIDITNDSSPNFLTFCVEIHEQINFSHMYVVDSIGLSTDASVPSKNKTLTSKAAWLYTSFLNGSLGTGFDGSNIGDLSNISLFTANQLQLAIWSAMGYTGGFAGSDISTYLGASWYTMYFDPILFSEWEAAFIASGWTGTGDVQILNLETLSGGHAQDQLVLQPSPPPEPGSGTLAPEPMSFLVWSLLAACVGFTGRRSV